MTVISHFPNGSHTESFFKLHSVQPNPGNLFTTICSKEYISKRCIALYKFRLHNYQWNNRMQDQGFRTAFVKQFLEKI